VRYFKFLLVFNFFINFYNKIQYNCNLIERCLQSSGVYIETGQSLEFSGGFRDVWRTLGWGFEMYDKVWQRNGGGQNWSKIAWHTLWTAPILHWISFKILFTQSQYNFSNWSYTRLISSHNKWQKWIRTFRIFMSFKH